MFDFVLANGQTQRAYVEDENGYLSSQQAERGRAWEESSGGGVTSEEEKMKNGGVGMRGQMRIVSERIEEIEIQ